MSSLAQLIEQINEWDQKVSVRLNGRGGKFITYGLRIVSFLGRETIWLLLIVFYIFIWFDPLMFMNIGIAYLIGLIVIVPMKKWINRGRPFRKIAEIRVSGREPTSGSFPSWHAYNIVSQSIVFLYIFPNIVLIIISLIFIIIVSFSRVQMGVHYPSDVILGLFLGIVGGLSTISIFSPLFLKLFNSIQKMNPGLINNILYTINPLLFHNILYFLVCILLFGAILLLGGYKFLKEIIPKK
jgi:undecaprenyl-diphosphatase